MRLIIIIESLLLLLLLVNIVSMDKIIGTHWSRIGKRTKNMGLNDFSKRYESEL